MEENTDYYFNEAGLMVFTEAYHLKRGYCCKNKCRHCPWHYGKEKKLRLNKQLNKDNQEFLVMLKETKAPRYESAFHEAMVNIAFTQNWCNDKIKNAVSPYDVTTQQFNVLRILRGQFPNPSTINLIKSKVLDKMCDASRIVDRLVQKGLVIKKVNTYDKRAVDILINDKGLLLLKQMDEEVSLSAILSSNLSQEEAEQLIFLLDKTRGNL